jgi:serine/threonine-protein kinase
VCAVIDGVVQAASGRVRLTVRLLDAATGVQLWCEHHDGGLGDLFAFQESIARKVAEELRVELATLAHCGSAPTEAIDRYLAARREIRGADHVSAAQAVSLLDRALELAPAFTPALAAHAIASVRAWFSRVGSDAGPGWEQRATESVARALARAPELAETHLAAGMYAAQRGDYQAAAGELVRALDVAPTYAEAHEYLGALQCEAGQVEEGMERLRLASELDPTLAYCVFMLARQHALSGDGAGFAATLAELRRRHRAHHFPYAPALDLRIAVWREDRAEIRRALAEDALRGHPYREWTMLHARSALGEVSGEEVDAAFGEALAEVQSQRFRSMLVQLWAEACAASGRHEAALARITSAAEGVLVDLAWLDGCPLFAPLRGRPAFAEARRRVRDRADAIWTP